MSAINTSIRSIRAPLQAIARRQYSSAAPSVTNAAVVVGHSNQRLAIVAGTSFAIGVDATYVYYNFPQKNEKNDTA